MADPDELQELIAYLVRTSRLSAPEVQRVVAEVLNFLHETPEAFVRRRHLALQAEGLSNTAIYLQLATELSVWRFRAPPYSARQIRRIIYG
ncbi:MAG TPA: hypothetical protein VGV09_02740 [Steroidobacteraceae bacterium]|nr:hypothetical protein [Steroidobacteraceae bacterium]